MNSNKQSSKQVDNKWLRGIQVWIVGSILTLLVGGEAGGAILLILELLVMVTIVAIIVAIANPKKIFDGWVQNMPTIYWYIGAAVSSLATVVWVTYVPNGYVMRLLTVIFIGFGMIFVFVYGAILHIKQPKQRNHH